MKHELNIAVLALVCSLSGAAVAADSPFLIKTNPGGAMAGPANGGMPVVKNVITNVQLSSYDTKVGQPVKVTVNGTGQCALMLTTMTHGAVDEQTWEFVPPTAFPYTTAYMPNPNRLGYLHIYARVVPKHPQYNPNGVICHGTAGANLNVRPGEAYVAR